MRETPQACLHSPDDDPDILERLPQFIGVDDGGAVGTMTALVIGGIHVRAADLFIRGVIVQHGIQVPGADAEEELWTTQGLERLDVLPIRLGNDADLEPVGLKVACDERDAEAGVVDVSVAGDEDDIQFGPAELFGFG